MRYLALSLFLCAIVSFSLPAQKYYDLDFSNVSFEDQAVPSNINYQHYYQASEQDLMIGNPSNSDIVRNQFFYFGAPIDNDAAKVSYTAVEVCYDVFDYKINKLRTPPFQIPSRTSANTLLGKLPVDSRAVQIRIAQPLKSKPGKFEVIYDLLLPTARTEGYQCFRLDFPTPYILPLGTRVSAWSMIGAKDVIRYDRIRLIRG